jgi:acetylornithine/succinyldiaminopimelate/putrescine aminotransferase
VTGERLADAMQPGDHGSTFAGGPVACAAALVALELCGEPELLASVRQLGERLAGSLAELSWVASVRGRGLLVGADLLPGVSAVEIARRALLEQRLVINATGPGTLRFEPPLLVSEADIDEAVARLDRLAP